MYIKHDKNGLCRSKRLAQLQFLSNWYKSEDTVIHPAAIIFKLNHFIETQYVGVKIFGVWQPLSKWSLFSNTEIRCASDLGKVQNFSYDNIPEER